MKNIFRYILLTGLVFAIASCTDDFEEINTDPNSPSEVPTDFLISTVQKRMMDNVWDEWFNGRFGLLYAQYWSQNQYSDESRYFIRTGVVNNYWSYFYAGRATTASDPPTGGGLIDAQEIIDINNEKLPELEGSSAGAMLHNQNAIVKILQVWLFQIMTDVWGDIPYENALKGAEDRFPRYTQQSEIYPDLLATLDEAIAEIDESVGAFGSSDLIYGSDMTKWKKFANSLKLRVAIRMADVASDLAKDAVEKAYAGAFESNDDNALFVFFTGAPNNNPLNQDRIERGDADFGISATIVDELLRLNDPRVEFYADRSQVTGEFEGMPYGLLEDNANAIPTTEVSQPSGAGVVRGDASYSPGPTDVLAATAPGVFMDYAEVCFIMAEAVERGYSVSGTAKEWYDRGIRASMDYWSAETLSEADINDYLAQPTVDYDAQSEPWNVKIGRQKWLAMYMQGIQGWTEWRRLDFGILVEPESYAYNGSVIPTRWPYPTDEQTKNSESYAQAIQSQPDQMDAKVWWDTK